ncbi:hypothetical protein N8I74_04790 [Chitiniphilus purpureus]|uniref:Sel1 repeat family protein n=1 Tax=Chitiniphilus purpureus TaxID=2981137 RepID=A0ABY6DPQ2_9NEIS|nr:hypothetical protein [Chitiniphilus sp. CD1]UXY16339.1 hypothetical protein N8I74_04790 [Chitiniphilus sp. CD1]
MKRMLGLLLAACCSVAGASEGMVQRALESRNYELAFATARADVDDGSATDVTRMLLAQLYLQGQGTNRDPLAAEKLLRPLAGQGTAEAQFLLAGTLMAQSADRLLGEDGDVDRAKLKAQAARPASARPLEREAAEWLMKAAAQKLPRALNVLATELGNLSAGLTSAQKAAWFEAAGKPEWAQATLLGESLVSLRLRREVLLDPAVQAALQQQALAAGCNDEDLKLVATRLDGPVRDADYLTLRLAPPVNYTLLAGNWREIWSTGACGKRFDVTLAFQADGLGGASFTLQPVAPSPKPKAAPAR